MRVLHCEVRCVCEKIVCAFVLVEVKFANAPIPRSSSHRTYRSYNLVTSSLLTRGPILISCVVTGELCYKYL